jgi:hypothetical protein
MRHKALVVAAACSLALLATGSMAQAHERDGAGSKKVQAGKSSIKHKRGLGRDQYVLGITRALGQHQLLS